MAFFWSGSSWSPWSQFVNSDSFDSGSDTSQSDTAVQTTSTRRSLVSVKATTATTVVQQVTVTSIRSIIPLTTLKSSATSQNLKSATAATVQKAQIPSSSLIVQHTTPNSSILISSSSSSSAPPILDSTAISISSNARSSSSSSTSSPPKQFMQSDWVYWGCVDNINGIPALNTTYATSEALTPELCILACSATQYHFAGLQNGNACFCGSFITSSSISSDSTLCTSPCSGNDTSICGGSKSMSFYHLNSFDPNNDTSVDNANPGTSSGSLNDYEGSMTMVATLPEFTGTLMEYGDPRFKSNKDGVVFGKVLKVSSALSIYDHALNGGSIFLIAFSVLRILR
ncbi:uncharacterized protein I206_103131 [Kwoniella pini CBS 10737]|uniref:WSC domain-containing protein n=1 Tax=Kwoniella pini CBS 10737 TaxID=1296096 RepID=A0A1B9IAC2_9TREE|nr:uncharacterized protein I206_01865 [Kwoniella pini CBS 10737]OCF52572.1 hypothetical protein I206_01865 [Kwoniella pini CBS 10737]